MKWFFFYSFFCLTKSVATIVNDIVKYFVNLYPRINPYVVDLGPWELVSN